MMGNPTLEVAIQERLTYFIWKQKNLWVPHLRVINPLEETASTLILQNKFFFQSHCQGFLKIKLIEFKRKIKYSQSYRDNNIKHEWLSLDV
jgi:hypothetical protein